MNASTFCCTFNDLFPFIDNYRFRRLEQSISFCFLTFFSSSSYLPNTAPKMAPNQRNNINYDMCSYERNYLEFQRNIPPPSNILLQNFIIRWFLIQELL